MELMEFGRRHRALVVPLAAVPLLAAAAGAGWAAAQPAEYRHAVDVQVPAPGPQASAAAVEQSVSTYRTLISSSRVVAAVERQTGVRAATVRAGLDTQRPAQGAQRGTLVRVVYVGPERTRAPEITRAAAVVALDELVRPLLATARQTETEAAATVDAARSVLTALSRRYGGLPTEEYRSLQSQVAALEAERDAPTGNRSPGDVVQAIEKRKRRLAVLAPRVVEAQALQDRLAQTNRKHADAQQVTRDLQARLTSADAALAPSAARAFPVSRTPVVLRTAAVGAGVGLLLAVVIFLVAAPRRRPVPVPPAETGPRPEPLRLT
ncbi:hypothetical protein DPM19_30660 [Actinomadura craniellae]|uniref:Polysaccharide chain length determinant N-terminal domain-containing protein n=1 Tax=Actinomadura craniellae TaxID=2231787 RepID=A0A365GX98_9ACTN|nr:hypothetical protein [Actinomadura craniellae]RAY11388.1 hypothetical protein DPM19_30660 [Actinomadura craniellae]